MNDNTAATTTTTIPPWLVEHCYRLRILDPDLSNLNLNIRRFNVYMMRVLCAAIQINRKLQTLNLTSTLSNSPPAIEPLALQVLAHHKSLRCVHLSYNRLYDVRSIGTALITNTCLVELYLDYNQIDGESNANALAKGIQHNHALQVLQLSYNQLGDVGCYALAEAIRYNTSLRVLGLRRNGVTTIGATYLEDALKRSNYSLYIVDLQENQELSVAQIGRVDLLCHANRLGRSYLLRGHHSKRVNGATITSKVVGSNHSTKAYVSCNKAADENALAIWSSTYLDEITASWTTTITMTSDRQLANTKAITSDDILYFFLRSAPDSFFQRVPPKSNHPAVERMDMEALRQREDEEMDILNVDKRNKNELIHMSLG